MAHAFERGLGSGGLEFVCMRHASGSTVTVQLFGAHVTSLKTPSGDELLWMSSASALDGSAPIRGGIPVVFPQFGSAALPGIADGCELPMHGFARRFRWRVVAQRTREGGTLELRLELRPTDLDGAEGQAVRKAWSHDFVLRYTILLHAGTEQQLFSCTLEVHNPFPARAPATSASRRIANLAKTFSTSADEGWDFQALLHTYFAVADVARMQLHGFRAAPYFDRLTPGDALQTEEGEVHCVERETDRVYAFSSGPLARDVLMRGTGIGSGGLRVRRVVSAGSTPDCVLWNPWVNKSKAMADFDDWGWRNMVCIEPGLHVMPGHPPGRLVPGATATLTQIIDVDDRS